MHIYFIGIGGVGIGPLAEVAHDVGYRVTGNDLAASPVTENLNKKNIDIHIGSAADHLKQTQQKKPIDWLVYTAALPEDAAELRFAKNAGIKCSKRDGFLNHLLREKNLKLLAISGTHGKTTTTAMIIWLAHMLKLPISYAVGTTLSFAPSGHYNSASQYFVYECDEYDRNFLRFTPEISIITSLDYDHPDTYPTRADYEAAFVAFAAASKQTICWLELASALPVKNGYGPKPGLEDTVALPGIHNRKNGALAITLLQQISDFSDTQLAQAINNFPGSDRRFEKLAVHLYSDYAHHPVEIAATLQLASELKKPIIAVYQPHQNIRQHELAGEYKDCFERAQKVYWLPTYLSREDPSLPIITPEKLIQNLSNPSTAEPAEMGTELWSELQAARADGKLVVVMGAGDIDSWLRTQLANHTA